MTYPWLLRTERVPAATADVFDDAWVRTGDIAIRADTGYLSIGGRKYSDLIKSGGFKIGAGEIEAILLEHPEGDGATATADDLPRHVASLLAVYKRPRAVHCVDSLPRNAIGKVTERDLS